MRSARLIPFLGVLAALLLAPAPGQAQVFENSVRVRAGWYSPSDLPTDSGMFPGLEVRNLLKGSDGIFYGISHYKEEISERKTYGTTEFKLEADVEILPILVGWFHLWGNDLVELTAGAGVGLYEVKAFSGGYSLGSGVQVVDFGDYRPLSDDTRVGGVIFGGVDFFARSPWGLGIEGRFHVVEDDLGGAEIAVSGLFRF